MSVALRLSITLAVLGWHIILTVWTFCMSSNSVWCGWWGWGCIMWPWHVCGRNVPLASSSLPPSHYIPQLGIPAAPLQLGTTSDAYVALLMVDGLPLLSPSRVQSIRILYMYRHQPRRQFLTTVSSMHPYPLSGLVYDSLPIIRRSYTAFDWVPAVRQGRQIIPKVFLSFLQKITLCNNLTRLSNAPCNQTRSVNTSRPSFT